MLSLREARTGRRGNPISYRGHWPFCLILGGIFLLSGCAKLAHLDQLLTLKKVSEEGDALHEYVDEQERKFDLLLKAVKENTLSLNTSQKDILWSFGDYVYKKEVTWDGQPTEVWLYRHTKGFFDSEKVYLYFNQTGQLLKWEYVPAPAKKHISEKSDGTEI